VSTEKEDLISRLLKGGYIVHTCTLKDRDTGEVVKLIIDIWKVHDKHIWDEWTRNWAKQSYVCRVYSVEELKIKTERLLKGN